MPNKCLLLNMINITLSKISPCQKFWSDIHAEGRLLTGLSDEIDSHWTVRGEREVLAIGQNLFFVHFIYFSLLCIAVVMTENHTYHLPSYGVHTFYSGASQVSHDSLWYLHVQLW